MSIRLFPDSFIRLFVALIADLSVDRFSVHQQFQRKVRNEEGWSQRPPAPLKAEQHTKPAFMGFLLNFR
jgi:hypothetical protein